MATYSHGVASIETGAYGLYQSWDNDDAVQIITADDADGDPADYAAIRREQTVTIELILDTTKTLPAAGAEITLTDVHIGSSKKVVVESVKSSNKNNDFIRATIVGKRWPTNNLPS